MYIKNNFLKLTSAFASGVLIVFGVSVIERDNNYKDYKRYLGAGFFTSGVYLLITSIDNTPNYGGFKKIKILKRTLRV